MSQAALGIAAAAGAGELDSATRRRAIISSAVGNFVELYDFLIYGMFAAQIAANFFPKEDPPVPQGGPTGGPAAGLRDLRRRLSSCDRSARS